MELGYAPGWRPDEGDKVVGKIADVTMGRSNFGNRRYPIITVHDEESDALVAVHCFHAGLLNRMMELKPQVGERIGVQYLGMREHQTQPDQTIAQYAVRIDGRSADVWGALAAESVPATVPGTVAPSDIPASAGDFTLPTPAPADDDIPF